MGWRRWTGHEVSSAYLCMVYLHSTRHLDSVACVCFSMHKQPACSQNIQLEDETNSTGFCITLPKDCDNVKFASNAWPHCSDVCTAYLEFSIALQILVHTGCSATSADLSGRLRSPYSLKQWWMASPQAGRASRGRSWPCFADPCKRCQCCYLDDRKGQGCHEGECA